MARTVNWDQTNTTEAGSTTFSAGPDTFTLTPDSTWQVGLVTLTQTFDVDYDFTVSFESYFGDDNLGADGITFLFHNDPLGDAVVPGNGGWELGTTNIENAWAVEFDTYDNSFDPSYDHTQLRGQSDAGGAHDYGYRFTNHTGLDATNVEDGQWHTTSIDWDAASRTLTVVFDGVTAATWTYDLFDFDGDGVSYSDFDTVLDGSDKVYFTFGGATGGATNEQAVRSIQTTGTICFVRGTRIRVPGGEVPVHKLKAGDLVTVLDGSARPIRWIGHTQAKAHGNTAPIRFAPGTVGNRRPLKLSPQHRLYIADWRAEVFMGVESCLVPAFGLVNGTSVRQIDDGRDVEYWHILFDQHEVIFAEGAPAESFHPGSMAMATLAQSQWEDVLRSCPQVFFEDAVTVLPTVPAGLARAFADTNPKDAGSGPLLA